MTAQERRYEIVVQARVDGRWFRDYEDVEIVALAAGRTAIVVTLRDQAALHGFLTQVRDLALPLLLVRELTPGPDPGRNEP